MIKAILFDMDGVIVDSEPFHYEVETKIHRHLGIEIPAETRKHFVGLANNVMWEFIKKEFGLHQKTTELMDIAIRIRMEELINLPPQPPIPGIPELLEFIKDKNLKTAIASSSTPQFIFTMMEKVGLTAWFNLFISGDQVNKGKPEPDIFLEAAKQLRVLPEECIVIEDSANGVKAAKAAGMYCIGFQNPNSGDQDLSPADIIVKEIREIRDLLPHAIL